MTTGEHCMYNETFDVRLSFDQITLIVNALKSLNKNDDEIVALIDMMKNVEPDVLNSFVD
jgi:hypothetical protein